ncbi:hypothetical protein RRG08_063404 [Elysia crispata]|uniref:Uncharacterized protein n=1 Tax=Elysia crispata TaxID=231223 RepID=A0AAE1AA16_9GAST|nr:hypothetical protein RRG08_063404 [Elysia crispata]
MRSAYPIGSASPSSFNLDERVYLLHYSVLTTSGTRGRYSRQGRQTMASAAVPRSDWTVLPAPARMLPARWPDLNTVHVCSWVSALHKMVDHLDQRAEVTKDQIGSRRVNLPFVWRVVSSEACQQAHLERERDGFTGRGLIGGVTAPVMTIRSANQRHRPSRVVETVPSDKSTAIPSLRATECPSQLMVPDLGSPVQLRNRSQSSAPHLEQTAPGVWRGRPPRDFGFQNFTRISRRPSLMYAA